jgi:dolichol-phosphate mannosyltransferase
MIHKTVGALGCRPPRSPPCSMTARTWLTLPTYNEVANIERIIRAIVAQLERAIPGDFQVLVIDDSSPDGTGEVADRLAEEIPEVCVLHRKEKDGLGRAYLAGFQYAVDQGAELVGVMDADFSHDPAYLPMLLEAANDADLVIGSRYVEGGQIADWPPLRRLLSRGGSLYARSILGVHVRDLTGGFKFIRREVLERIDLRSLRAQGYVFNIELTYRALMLGCSVKEIPIVFRDRTEGRSKMSLPVAIEALFLVPKLRRSHQRIASSRAEETAAA